jgi:hypothetical protein
VSYALDLRSERVGSERAYAQAWRWSNATVHRQLPKIRAAVEDWANFGRSKCEAQVKQDRSNGEAKNAVSALIGDVWRSGGEADMKQERSNSEAHPYRDREEERDSTDTPLPPIGGIPPGGKKQKPDYGLEWWRSFPTWLPQVLQNPEFAPIGSDCIAAEYQKADDWLRAGGKRKADYRAFFRNWLRNNKHFSQKNGNSNSNSQSKYGPRITPDGIADALAKAKF